MNSGRLTSFLCTILATFSLAEGIPYLTVEQGELFGRTVDVSDEGGDITEIDEFLGIPFAEPPERFSPPEPRSQWDGQWNASYPRSMCVQKVDVNNPTLTRSEDCLYLNVYAPNPKPSGAAVMVWIHGGSFTTGTGYTYGGRSLVVTGNVIVVSINYRLNIFGFFSTGDEAASGNYGLLDQQAALQWVQKNIEAFGGDPSRVTLFGESAGAGSVDLHRYSKGSRNLFSQTIIQSGSALALWSLYDNPVKERETAMLFGSVLGCSQTNTQRLVECLRNVDAEDIVAAYLANGSPPIAPNLDGLFIDESPHVLAANGDFKQGPLLAGFNEDEGTYGVLIGIYSSYYGSKTAPVIDSKGFDDSFELQLKFNKIEPSSLLTSAVRQQYIDWDKFSEDKENYDLFDAFVKQNGDDFFSCNVMASVQAQALTEYDAFLYYFTINPSLSVWGLPGFNTPWLAAAHGEDLPFVFSKGFVNREPYYDVAFTEQEKEMSRIIRTLWTNFANSGDPSRASRDEPAGVDELNWPAYNISDQYYKVLNEGFPVDSHIKNTQCAFWNGLFKELLSFTQSLDEAQFEWRNQFSTWKKDITSWRSAFQKYKTGTTCTKSEN